MARPTETAAQPQAPTAAPSPVRQRLLDAATQIVASRGWGAVTMAGVGEAAGVSRQTVYNEVGSKQGLAEALVVRESALFVGAVQRELAADGSLPESMRRAAAQVFAMAQDNPLLLAAVSAAHGGSQDLLPLLTTQSQGLIGTAAAAVEASIRTSYPQLPMPGADLGIAVTALVRLVLSLMMRPSGSADEMAAQVGWICERLFSDPGVDRGR